MNKLPIKNILIVLAIFSFFATFTFVVINIAQGKKVTSDGKLIDTSIIFLNTFPQEVKIFINDKEVNKSGNRIEGILPGEITLKLTKDGYTSWEKKVILEPKKVKEINAQLYPTELNPEKISDFDIDKISFNEGANFVFFTVLNAENKDDLGIWKYKLTKGLFDFGNNRPEQIARFDTDTIESLKLNPYSLITSPDSNRIIFNIPESKTLFIYNTNSFNDFTNFVEKFGYYPNNINWFRNSNAVVVSRDNVLFEYDLQSGQSTLIYFDPSNAPIFGINDNKIYLYRPNEKKIYSYINKESLELKLPTNFELPEDIKRIFAFKSNSDLIILYTEKSLIFLDLKKNYIEEFAKNAQVLAVSNNGNSVLYRKDEKYFSYTLEPTFDALTYKSELKEVMIPDGTPINFYFTTNNKSIITNIADENGNIQLWILDTDGSNPVNLKLKNKISKPTAQMLNDGKSIYVLLEDQEEIEENTPVMDNTVEIEPIKPTNYLFKVNLEIKK